ncbi:MAG: glycosyltransferase family 9 protein [Vicinamibacterales bacterium]
MTILLVRLRLIGDVVFTTPAIRALARHFPGAHIIYVVEDGALPVVARNPYVAEVVSVPHVRGWRRLTDDVRVARRLRAARVDLAIDFHGGPRSAWLTWASRAPRRVGYDVQGRTWMYTDAVHRPRELRPRHSVENQWDLLAVVDPALSRPADPVADRVEMAVDPAWRAAVDRRLAAWGVRDDARVIAIHVSAGNPFRRWPESAFAELAGRLAAADGRRWVVLAGGPSDREATSRVLATARAAAGAAASRIVDGEGMPLGELRALMDRAALFIGGDSGPLHVASTSDVPIVGLYGPTLPARSAPWRPRTLPTASVDAGDLPCRPCDQRVCAPGDFRCLTTVPAAAVRAAAERLLEAAR